MLLKEKIQKFLVAKGLLEESELGTVWGDAEQKAWAAFCDKTPGFGRYATKSPSYENIAAAQVAIIEAGLSKTIKEDKEPSENKEPIETPKQEEISKPEETSTRENKKKAGKKGLLKKILG